MRNSLFLNVEKASIKIKSAINKLKQDISISQLINQQLLACAIPEPISPPPTTVTVLIAFKDAEWENFLHITFKLFILINETRSLRKNYPITMVNTQCKCKGHGSTCPHLREKVSLEVLKNKIINSPITKICMLEPLEHILSDNLR